MWLQRRLDAQSSCCMARARETASENSQCADPSSDFPRPYRLGRLLPQLGGGLAFGG
jgi:hypothetical protein